jgi:hypothetical protein
MQQLGKILLATFVKRDEAVSVLKELIDNCPRLDGHPLEITPPNTPTPSGEGYQIFIIKTLDLETKKCVIDIVMRHHLAYQVGSMWKTRRSATEPDTFIIYRPKK